MRPARRPGPAPAARSEGIPQMHNEKQTTRAPPSLLRGADCPVTNNAGGRFRTDRRVVGNLSIRRKKIRFDSYYARGGRTSGRRSESIGGEAIWGSCNAH